MNVSPCARVTLAGLCLLPMLACGQDPDPATLLGGWSCVEGACPDEAIAFSIEDGVRVYSSWLHERPSAVDGRWSLEGTRLTIACCDGPDAAYEVLELTPRVLRLRDPDAGDEALLKAAGGP